jgi:hypothetical protein
MARLLNLWRQGVDDSPMDASAYAFNQGIRSTRSALRSWNLRPWPVLRLWLAGSLAAGLALLVSVWVIAGLSSPSGPAALTRPPLVVGDRVDVVRILGRNGLVLALHAMACVAGFIAGSSLPLQAEHRTGLARLVHERGARLAMLFVASATVFSLGAQAYVLGISVAHVAGALHTSSGLLLLGLLPHALPELMALFLPLAAWIIASRRGEWNELLAATVVTVLIAFPMLVTTALWEVYVSPHVLQGLIGYS